MPETYVIGVQLDSSIVKAFDLTISAAGDVYANYSMTGLPEAHASYHASGQQHIKKGGKYVEWNGGPSGNFEPMRIYRARPKEVITRSDCGNTIGWEVPKLSVLPVLTDPAHILVDARCLRSDSILAFKTEVIGQWSRPRPSVSGYPILATQRFGRTIQVEVNAFLISDLSSGTAQLETF